MASSSSLVKPRRQNDELLKGAFEENFPDFLRFLYSDADDIFDLSRGIQFMDKELLAIGLSASLCLSKTFCILIIRK